MAEPNPTDANASKELTGRVGKYQIVRPLGKGAMGQVYVAHDTVLERDVALKVMVASIADDPELKARFEREARAVAKMTHPNVVTVFDLGSHTDGSPYIAMELLKGRDLQKLLREQAVPLERRISIIVQVLAGLAHAHQAGIVHRDIKPANIFINDDGSAKIMDFGVARLTTASMTGTGSIVGTADYMSPEQVKAAKVDGRSDLFSVGCMIYELVTGRRPFHSDNLMAIFYKITHEEPDYDLVPAGPEYDALLPIIRKALAKDIPSRYQTAYEFAVELRQWLHTHAAAAPHVLEGLVEIEAPSQVPMPLTEAPGMTYADPAAGTVELGTGSSRSRRMTTPPRTMPGQAAGTVVRADQPTVFVESPPTAMPRATERPVARIEPPAPARSMLVPGLAIGAVMALAVVGGGILWKLNQPVTPGPDALVPASPVPTATVEAAPPVTVAPQPTFAPPPEGKTAAGMRAAQAAFKAGNYERAVAAAQEVLSQEPGNAGAKTLLEQSMAGQGAQARLTAGESALNRGDFAAAEREVAAALQQAPWERGAADLQRRIHAARQQAQHEADSKAQQTKMTQVNEHLNEATAAMQARQFDAALAAYDKALALDPGNVAAQTGKQGAISAKIFAETAARPVQAEHGFVAGRTETKASDSGGGLVGFSNAPPGVNVKKATQGAEMPGRILFEVQPASPSGGERFRITVSFANDGPQAIPLATRMNISTTVDGKRQGGPLAPGVTTVAPASKAVVWQSPADQVWRDGTVSWQMEVTLFTQKGDSYKNTLTWK